MIRRRDDLPLLCRTLGHKFREAAFPLLRPPLVCMRCGKVVHR